MRTAKILINGQEHLLCFSVRALRAVVDRYGGVDGLNTATKTEDQTKNLDEALWQLATMMDAGARYAALEGLPNADPLTLDQLYDVCDISDFVGIRAAVQRTITSGISPSLQTDHSKNQEATGETA